MSSSETTSLPIVSWSEMFGEGERRIKSYFLDAVILTPARDRARLLTQRETVQRMIVDALESKNKSRLHRAFREQVKLLAKLEETCRETKSETISPASDMPPGPMTHA